MSSFSYTVDTSEMAQSLDQVSKHVDRTALAVAAMETAVIAAEQQAAEAICENVDRGFYSLIRSQISTKIAERFSVLNAKYLVMKELSKSLTAKQDRMERDVARLRGVYYKTFHGLDVALEHRVAELDTKSYQLAEARNALFTMRLKKDAAQVICFAHDTASVEQLSSMARLYSRAGDAIEHMGENIKDSLDYKSRVSGSLENVPAEDIRLECVPVLYMSEESMVSEGSYVTNVYVPESLDRAAADRIRSHISGAGGFTESRSEDEKQKVANEFHILANRENLPSRVSDVMLRLLEKGDWI